MLQGWEYKMIWFSDGELIGEVCRCYRQEVPWFWYRDVFLQAEQRGVVRIDQEGGGNPFWWLKFEDAVEVLSDKLATVMREETSWRG